MKTDDLSFRDATAADGPFMNEMHHEAVYWRRLSNPQLAEANETLEPARMSPAWGRKKGDLGLIALLRDVPIGAVWIRYWTTADAPMGFVSTETPVLGIAVSADYRSKRFGKQLMQALFTRAKAANIKQVSLNVSKDNYAQRLYLQAGFTVVADRGDAVTMVRKL